MLVFEVMPDRDLVCRACFEALCRAPMGSSTVVVEEAQTVELWGVQETEKLWLRHRRVHAVL